MKSGWAAAVFWLLGCWPVWVTAADVLIDTDRVSHTFSGLGAQVWAGDLNVQPLLSDLQMRYVRLEAFCNWASVSQTPPTDGLRSSFDQYVSSNFGSARLSQMKQTMSMLTAGGIEPVFNQFHYPSAWRTSTGVLRTSRHADVALLWGAQMAYLKTNGVEARYVELFNEPEGTWNCRVPPAQYNDVVKRVRAELDDRGLGDVQIVGPGLAYLNHDGQSAEWLGALDAQALEALGAFSTHAWDETFAQGCGPEYLRQAGTAFMAAVTAADPSRLKPVFVTEYMTANRMFHGTVYLAPGSTYMDSASETLPYAVRVAEHTLSLLNAGASVLFAWEAADQSWSDSSWGLQRRSADASGKRPVYYALRTLSHSIPAGARVLAVGPQDNGGIYLAAFRSGSEIILAAVNGTSASQTKSIAFGAAVNPLPVIVRSFDANGSGNGAGMFEVVNDEVLLTLPSDSLVTLTFEASGVEPQKVLEWKFEGAVEDTSGLGNHATTVSGSVAFAEGRFGQALRLDGLPAVVELAGGANLPLAADDDWSMNLWVYADRDISAGGDYHALALAAMGTNSWAKNGNARSIGNWGWGKGISFYSTTMMPTIANVPYDVGQWQMITVTYDHGLWQQGATVAGDSLKIYKNGLRIASFNPQGRYYTGGFRQADHVVSLLADIPDQSPMRFEGRLDDFSIWRGVLSPSRIAAMASRVPRAGDLNDDGQCDLGDVTVLAEYWLSTVPLCVADLDDDERVNWEDFAALAGSVE